MCIRDRFKIIRSEKHQGDGDRKESDNDAHHPANQAALIQVMT